MELVEYVRIIRKWLWLIIATAFVGGGISFILASQQVPYYEANATLSIGLYIQDPNPTTNQIYIGQNLVATYQQLLGTHDLLQGVIDTLKLPITTDQLKSLFTSDVVPNTSLLVIHARYFDPILTANIANAVANQLILNSPTNLTADQQDQVDFANTQIRTLSDQVSEQRTLKNQLDQQITAETDPKLIQQLDQQRTSLVDQINQASATIAQFQSTISNLQQRTNAVTLVDKAVIPSYSSASGSNLRILLGAITGGGLAFVAILVLDYLNDKVRTTVVATQILGLPVLGAVPRYGKKNLSYPDRLITKHESLSEVTEAYRRLRTNLVFATNQRSHKVFVITSSGPGEGKSITVSNLAVTMANAGVRVLLIDADLRRPTIHEIFGLTRDVGLSTLLLADPSNVPGAENQPVRSLDQCMQATQVPNLKIITSGFDTLGPAEVLGSRLMKRWVEAFQASANIDVILIDTPPVLMFSDSAIVAALANADVLLVIDGERTRRNAAVEARDRLQQVGVEITGLVVNRINSRDANSYYGEYYRSYYTSPAGADANKRGLRRFLDSRVPARK